MMECGVVCSWDSGCSNQIKSSSQANRSFKSGKHGHGQVQASTNSCFKVVLSNLSF